MDMITITIDGRELKCRRGTTLMQVANDNGIAIPSLCFHPEVHEGGGACRICMVEVHEGGRTIMATSCNYPVRSTIDVKTNTDKVRRIRKMLLELLVTRVTESDVIRDMAKEYGADKPRFASNPKEGNKKCTACGLCVQVCEDVVGANAIAMLHRGPDKKPGTPFGKISNDCIGCGACAYACPTNAINIWEDGEKRKIWNTEFKLVACKKCGQTFITDKQIEFIVNKTGKDRSFFDTCQNCRPLSADAPL